MGIKREVYEDALKRISKQREDRKDLGKKLKELGLDGLVVSTEDLDKMEKDIKEALGKMS